MKIKTADLRESVRLDRLGEGGVDGWGNPTPGTWETLIEAQPARLKPMGGDEQVRADRLTGSVRYELVLRWSEANAGIQASNRVVLARDAPGLPAGEVFNVKHAPVCPDERRRFLTLQVETGTAV